MSARASRPGARWAMTGVALIAVAQLSSADGAPAAVKNTVPVAIEVTARPIETFHPSEPNTTRFGPLEYRGGIELTSTDKNFGGLSALKMSSDGEHFLSLSDKGQWLRGRIVYASGRPTGIADAELAPMIGPSGRPLAAMGWYDTESLASDGDAFYVGIERVNRILRFNLGASGALDLAARGEPISVPAEVSKLPHNKGLESLAVGPKGSRIAGALIAISERALDKAGDTRGFLIGGKTPGEFTIKRSDDFDVSDCAFLPSGDLVILERRFAWTSGVAIRMRRIKGETIAPGAVLDGAQMMLADMGYQVDNMEGLGVHVNARGETILTLLSDDNFSFIQRTILLQFALIGE